MRLFRILTVLAFAASLAFISTPGRAQDQSTGDPVADAARKAREEKKAATKPKKVFTDDDVTPKPAEQPAPTAATGTESAEVATTKPAGTKAAAGQKEEDPNSEQAWRKRFAEQRRRISDAETELDVLQREASKADLQYYTDPQKAMQEQFTRDEINKKNAAIDAKKKDIADLKQQLSDLEDQLRAGGGDIGWSR
jgi:chromosome segregation ATPase